VVEFLSQHGTLVVAAAGNEHVQLDRDGRVASAGSLAFATAGRDALNDLRGLSEVPAGVPGVVAVGAVNRQTAEGLASETRFGQIGAGRRDQLAYYSNYGERIDVVAPGGSRNANLPRFDCLSRTCARLETSTPTATDNPGVFGAWGVNPATGAPCGDCFVFVQGTSMATPQVAGVAALALAARPGMGPGELRSLLSRSVTAFQDANATPAVGADPSRPAFNFDLDYGGPGVSNRLLGRGVIDAAAAVRHARAGD
jgi:subtilisin family serine protease